MNNPQQGPKHMIDVEKARQLAQRATSERNPIHPETYRESKLGWFFPYASGEELMVGSSGVIVHKRTGKVLELGSAFSVDRDIEAFDQGFQFSLYDLVITDVKDARRTLDLLEQLNLQDLEISYESGQVWRIPRPITRKELSKRISNTPVVFPDTQLYFHVESLLEAQESGAFEYRLFESPAVSRQ